MQENTLQIVTLAGLLHDVGKFYARSKRVQEARREAQYLGSHPIISTFIIEREFASQVQEIGVDTNLLKVLIRHHHEDPRFPPECLVQSLEGNEKLLALIVSRADNYSSSERYEESKGERGTYETVLLDSIFQRVDVGEGAPTTDWKIRPQELESENIFPKKIARGSWENLVENFGNEIKKLKAKDFDSLFIALLALIQKYCWSTPSDITKEVTDISLFDHLKTTSAIAACLYKYHQESNSLNEKAINDESLEKFMLIGGDLSGIQSYIYDIAEVGVGGTAKRLRARSFKLSILMEVTAHYILHQLGLPFSNLLFASGGRFYILASADQSSQGQFDSTKREIENWLLREFQGEIAINLIALLFSSKYFRSGDEDYPENFKGLWEKFGKRMEEAKFKKFEKAFKGTDIWNNKFLSETEFKNDPQSVCRVCRKFPAVKQEEDFKVCIHCNNDKEVGEELIKTKYLTFYKDGTPGNFNFYDNYAVKLSSSETEISGQPYLVCVLNSAEILANLPSNFKFLANYVPVFENREELEKHCQECSYLPQCEIKKDFREFPHIYNFQCIAENADGAAYLGTLKADVDNLGFIINRIPNLSISRLTTFSNFLDIFFSSYLPTLLKKKYRLTYVVYSGGDDLLLLGPWDQMPDLAKEIRDKFADFTCQNPNIHLSAGIALSKPKFPIANVSKFTTELLDTAKDKGRNRLAILSANFSWLNYDELINLAKILSDSIKGKIASSAFVYRLLTYQEMYSLYGKKRDNSGLLYLSHLAYDIKRNLYDSQGNPKDEHLVLELKKLFDYKGEGGMLMKNLKFPVSYALLKERE